MCFKNELLDARKKITQYDFSTTEFYDIDAIIMWMNEVKDKGTTHLDFTGYSNVVKCRAMYIPENDDLEMDCDDIL